MWDLVLFAVLCTCGLVGLLGLYHWLNEKLHKKSRRQEEEEERLQKQGMSRNERSSHIEEFEKKGVFEYIKKTGLVIPEPGILPQETIKALIREFKTPPTIEECKILNWPISNFEPYPSGVRVCEYCGNKYVLAGLTKRKISICTACLIKKTQ